MSAASLKDQLTASMKQALKEKQKETLGTIRLALSAIKQVEVDERIEVDDQRVIAILDKLIKQRRESIKQYESANRPDLADIESAEISVLQQFLPKPLSESEIDTLITEAIQQSDAKDMKDMGKVMGLLKPKLQGRADMSLVSKSIKASLSSLNQA